MENYKKLSTFFTIGWIVVFVIVIALVLNPKESRPVNDVVATTVVTTQKQTTTLAHLEEITIEEETTTQPTTENPDVKKAKESYWYLFDDQEYTCYVFKFSKDDSNVDLAYFSPETLQGLDAQYTTGFSIYRENGNMLSMKNLPDNFPIKKFDLEIKGDKIYCGKNELVKEKELSLDNALRHFV